MLILCLLVLATIVGMIASRRSAEPRLVYVPAALLGALIGAFAAFGDAPFLLRYPLVNPFTLGAAGSAAVSASRGRGDIERQSIESLREMIDMHFNPPTSP